MVKNVTDCTCVNDICRKTINVNFYKILFLLNNEFIANHVCASVNNSTVNCENSYKNTTVSKKIILQHRYVNLGKKNSLNLMHSFLILYGIISFTLTISKPLVKLYH